MRKVHEGNGHINVLWQTLLELTGCDLFAYLYVGSLKLAHHNSKQKNEKTKA